MMNRRKCWEGMTPEERREAARLEGEEVAEREHDEVEPEVGSSIEDRVEGNKLIPDLFAALREEERQEQDDL